MAQLKTMPSEMYEKILKGIPPQEGSGLFGLTCSPEESSLVILGVPWEPTASYGRGTSQAPLRIIDPSHQMDLYDSYYGDIFRYGIAYDLVHPDVLNLNEKITHLVEEKRLGQKHLHAINQASAQINEWVYQRSLTYLKQHQFVGILGGDHSCPLGLIQALGDHWQEPFGVLHIDAHHDLRASYEGHTFSHASIMHNVLTMVKEVSCLVQIGIRDFSFEESQACETTWKDRVFPYRDRLWQEHKIRGRKISDMIQDALKPLPDKVYISFDIDGLEFHLCPSTGTPVPGGLNYAEALYLLQAVVESGRKVIGFDLCEVGVPKKGEWDLNVGARILYQLCGSLLSSW